MLHDQQVGKNLVTLRGGLSQSDLAERMKLRGFRWSKATVWSIEKGERPLRVTEAAAVAEALGTSVDNFFQSPQSTSVTRRLEVVHAHVENLIAAAREVSQAQQLLAVILDTSDDYGRERASRMFTESTAADWAREGMREYRESLGATDLSSGAWMSTFLDAVDVELHRSDRGRDGERQATD